MSVNMIAASLRVSAGLVLALSSGMATIIEQVTCGCQTGRGACRWLFPSLRYSGKSRERNMRANQASRKCSRCTAQATCNAALRRQITLLRAEVAQLRAQLHSLQAQLSQTSANSHKPPSSDPPTRVRVKVRELSTRPRGGQPGHPGTTRALRPAAAVDELHVCQPTHCAGC